MNLFSVDTETHPSLVGRILLPDGEALKSIWNLYSRMLMSFLWSMGLRWAKKSLFPIWKSKIWNWSVWSVFHLNEKPHNKSITQTRWSNQKTRTKIHLMWRFNLCGGWGSVVSEDLEIDEKQFLWFRIPHPPGLHLKRPSDCHIVWILKSKVKHKP